MAICLIGVGELTRLHYSVREFARPNINYDLNYHLILSSLNWYCDEFDEQVQLALTAFDCSINLDTYPLSTLGETETQYIQTRQEMRIEFDFVVLGRIFQQIPLRNSELLLLPEQNVTPTELPALEEEVELFAHSYLDTDSEF